MQKHEYNKWQMEQIRKGLLDGLNINSYLNPSIDWIKMREIRFNLLNNC